MLHASSIIERDRDLDISLSLPSYIASSGIDVCSDTKFKVQYTPTKTKIIYEATDEGHTLADRRSHDTKSDIATVKR
jgi:hypothetical protein